MTWVIIDLVSSHSFIYYVPIQVILNLFNKYTNESGFSSSHMSACKYIHRSFSFIDIISYWYTFIISLSLYFNYFIIIPPFLDITILQANCKHYYHISKGTPFGTITFLIKKCTKKSFLYFGTYTKMCWPFVTAISTFPLFPLLLIERFYLIQTNIRIPYGNLSPSYNI